MAGAGLFWEKGTAGWLRLVAGGWFILREKYCWLVADKPSEQGPSVFFPLMFWVHFFPKVMKNMASHVRKNTFYVASLVLREILEWRKFVTLGLIQY
jgi:hypothetical protein